MISTLYRFPTAEGLSHLVVADPHNTATPPHLQVDSIHGSHAINGSVINPSLFATKGILDFDNLVCDFDETITDHDTTSSFDKLASQIRCAEHEKPDMSWQEILQAYLDDLDKVDCSDLCHLNQPSGETSTENNHEEQHQQQGHNDNLHHPQPQQSSTQPQSAKHHLLDPKVRELKCHIDGRKFTPEPELPVSKLPSLQPWIHSQVRKRAVEKVSLDRVYGSGNLIGLTRAQIRQYGREQIRLRPGMVELLRAFAKEQDRKEAENKRRRELWIVSVNWSQDLIRGAMDQVFGSEEATQRHLPDSNLISSNLLFSAACHEELMKRRKSSAAATTKGHASEDQDMQQKQDDQEEPLSTTILRSSSEPTEYLSNGMVKVSCLTGTDKLHAFQKIQRDYTAKHDLVATDTKWAYIGDSSTDLGCLVEADVGIIVGKSKSLLTECVRSGVRVIDLLEQDGSPANKA
ncbi:hypothetical protein BG011_000092 [Mortierella polycephala]|uniref:Uncharacterized protein n=1 Tax=Mortierella polycephala TaxID=41804 RepID=A0A9P6PJT3_9FUNG|nr:hypothetical protein BG011_000092 [Mortierella polycephala]